MNGGVGLWELIYPVLARPILDAGLWSYRFIGVAWMIHAARDLAYICGEIPFWPFMRTSSWGCMIFDAIIGIWFFADRRSDRPWNSDSADGVTGNVSTRDERTCWVSLRSGFRVPPELLKNAPPHHSFSGVEPKHPSCDFTNQAERFDYSAIKPEMVVPPVQPGIE